MVDSFIPVGETSKNLNTKTVQTAAGEVHNEIVELYDESPMFDAFGRLRTSDTGQRLDVEFLYDKQTDFFDEQTNSGTVAHNANSRDLTLSLSNATDGSYAWMSSHPVPYTPGNSQLPELTGVLNLADLSNGTVEVFLRSKISGAVTDIETVEQSAWEELRSGVDWSFSHIFAMDFQSLKVGRVRFGLNVAGKLIKVAEITNDNVRDAGFWQNPNLPAFYRLYNTATETIAEIGYGNADNAIGFRFSVAANANATMKAICCTVKSEGGVNLANLQGLPRSADTGNAAITVTNSLDPVMSIRVRSTFQSLENLALVLPKLVRLHTNESIRFEVRLGATLTGASWSNVDANHSVIEVDTSATAATGGKIIDSDFIQADTATIGPGSGSITPGDIAGILGKTVMWNRQGSETGILTVMAERLTADNASVFAKVNWEELR